MKIRKTELLKQNATQNSMNENSWWSKFNPILKTCYTIIKGVLDIIKIIDFIHHIIP